MLSIYSMVPPPWGASVDGIKKQSFLIKIMLYIIFSNKLGQKNIVFLSNFVSIFNLERVNYKQKQQSVLFEII